MADIAAGAKTRALGDCRYGQQNGKDRLDSSNSQPTLHPTQGLKEKEQRVSKTREMMVHKSAAKTETPRRRSRAQLPAKL